MFHGKRRLIGTLFAVSVAFYASAVAVGIYYSVRSDGSMPGLSLDYTRRIKEELKRGEIDLAIPQAELAIALDHATGHTAHYVMGAARAQQGKMDEAIHHFRQSLAMQRNYPDGHFGLAMALAQEAEAAITKYDNVGAVALLAESIGHFQETLRFQKDHRSATENLSKAMSLYATELRKEGRNLSRAGKHRRAMNHYRQAVKINPRDAETYNYLAEILATHPSSRFRDGKTAVQYAEKARHLADGQHPMALQTLAAAYAEAGRFDEAIKTAEVARNLATSSGQRVLANGIQFQLNHYRQRQPFRRPDWTK